MPSPGHTRCWSPRDGPASAVGVPAAVPTKGQRVCTQRGGSEPGGCLSGTWSSLSPEGGGEAWEEGWRPSSGRWISKASVRLRSCECGWITRTRSLPVGETAGHCCRPPGSVSAPLGHPCPSPAAGCHSRARCSHGVKPLGVCHLSHCAMAGCCRSSLPKPGLQEGPSVGRRRWPGLVWPGNPHGLAAMWGAALAPRSPIRGDSPLVSRKVVILGPSVLGWCPDSLPSAAEAQAPVRHVEG